MYLSLLDMSQYNAVKYSKVEDVGAFLAADEKDVPVDEPAKTPFAKRKWTSLRN